HPAIVVVIVFNDAAARLARLELALLLPLRLNLRLLLKNLRLLLLRLDNLRRRRLLCRRLLLRARSDDASHQNESRGREHQNLRLHVTTPSERWSTQLNSAGAILILRAKDAAGDLGCNRLKMGAARGKLRAEIATAPDRDCGRSARAYWFLHRPAHL